MINTSTDMIWDWSLFGDWEPSITKYPILLIEESGKDIAGGESLSIVLIELIWFYEPSFLCYPPKNKNPRLTRTDHYFNWVYN